MLDGLFIALNSSKIFGVFIILIMNIGSKYIMKDIPIAVDLIFESFWARMIVVFCIAFISTRDIFMSIMFVLLFILLFSYMLNEKSYSCVLKKTVNHYKNNINSNNTVTENDVKKAYNIIKEYQKNNEINL